MDSKILYHTAHDTQIW